MQDLLAQQKKVIMGSINSQKQLMHLEMFWELVQALAIITEALVA